MSDRLKKNSSLMFSHYKLLASLKI